MGNMLGEYRQLVLGGRRCRPQFLVLRSKMRWQSQEVQSKGRPFTKVHTQKSFKVVGITKDERRTIEAVASHSVNVFSWVLHPLQLEEKRSWP